MQTSTLRNYTRPLSKKISKMVPMKSLTIVAMFVMIGFIVPAYAANISNDETDVKVRELIKTCFAEIDSDDSLTAAEKTVAKRNCETNITNEYKPQNNDHLDLAKRRVLTENMEKCEAWHSGYEVLTPEQFKLYKNSQQAADCLIIYKDAAWQYDGKDRLDVLVDRLQLLKSGDEDIPEFQINDAQLTVTDIPELIPTVDEIVEIESDIIEMTNEQDQIADLEAQIKSLEEEIVKKDAIIQEQIKVILNLSSKIKEIIFEPLGILLAQF